jgi:hypothetical protein
MGPVLSPVGAVLRIKTLYLKKEEGAGRTECSQRPVRDARGSISVRCRRPRTGPTRGGMCLRLLARGKKQQRGTRSPAAAPQRRAVYPGKLATLQWRV